MIEKTTLSHDSGAVSIPRPVQPGQNIMPRGTELKRGDEVLKAGVRLRAQELGILATLGRTQLQVYRRPAVAVLSTEPGEELGPGQIRNSNAVMLQAQATRAGGHVQYLGIARDSVDSLRSLLEQGLRHDVLLITGGVSAGKVDLVPQVLAELGIEAVFHKVAMKPGKPILFARRGATLVFGLPGNPVSAFVGFELFVRPALRALQGMDHDSVCPQPVRFELTHEFVHKSDRPTYYPARVTSSGVTLPRWQGSADLRALSGTNAFAVVPPGEMRYAAGSPMDVLVPDLD
jgi:molybdopterin molybdotransferase